MRAPVASVPLVWQYWPIFALTGIFAALYPFPATFAAAVILFLDKRLWRGGRPVLALLAFSLGWLFIWLFMPQPPLQIPSWLERAPGKKTARFCAAIISVNGLPDRRLRLTLASVHQENGSETLAGNAVWTWDKEKIEPHPLPGQNICLTRPIVPIHAFRNEPLPPGEILSYTQNIFWRVWSKGEAGNPVISGKQDFFAALRWKMEKALLDRLGIGDDMPGGEYRAKALVPALLFGDRFFINQDISRKFSAAAIGHSLALSGQHLAIAGFFSYFFILGIGHFWPAFYLLRPKLVLTGFFACPFALFYLWLGGAPASLLRAACMLFIFCASCALYKNFAALDTILLAFCILLLANPFSVLTTGLQLSFLCVLILALFLPPLCKNKNFPNLTGRVFGTLTQILFVSMLIQLCLLPLTLKIFGSTGMWFPINVFWLPLLGMVVLPFSFFSLLLALVPFGWTAHAAGHLLEIAILPARWLIFLLDWLQRHQILFEPVLLRPHWSVLIGYGLIMAAFASMTKVLTQNGGTLFSKKFRQTGLFPFGNFTGCMNVTRSNSNNGFKCQNNKSAVGKIICLSLAFLACGPFLRLYGRLNAEPLLEALDVGQGQAILLHLEDGSRVLVDGGGLPSKRFDTGRDILTPLLTDNRPPGLEAIINSHPDLDHLGGLIHLLENFKYQVLFHNGRMAKGSLHDKWSTLQKSPNSRAIAAGDRIEFTGSSLYLEVLSPPENGAPLSSNNASLILRLCKDGKGLALLPGDAEIESLKKIASSGRDISAEVLIAPHHGSNSSFSPQFLAAVRPAMIIASCGFRNRYFYPGKQLRAWAKKNGVKLADTGETGRIGIRLDDMRK